MKQNRPDDVIAHFDFAHLSRVVASLIAPVRRLANSDVVPSWAAGG
ncbi:MAG: hypothetical protein M3458_14025 [Acidobacteriota bacterium]|nr:hypothetical protein [Acidobacteriota bacterium]